MQKAAIKAIFPLSFHLQRGNAMLRLAASAAQGSRAGLILSCPSLAGDAPHKADPVVVSSTWRATQTAARSTSPSQALPYCPHAGRHQHGSLSAAGCQTALTDGPFLSSPPAAWEERRKTLRTQPSTQSSSPACNFLQSPATKPLLLTAGFNYCFPAVRVTRNLICVSVSLMLVFVSSFVTDLSKMFH